MKKNSLFFTFYFAALMLLEAQIPPSAFNYSAVARKPSGQPIATSTVGIQISIVKTTAQGSVEYSENHAVNTDQFGLFNLTVGGGAVQSGSMNTIDWSSDNYYLKVGMDTSGGTSFLTMGTTQLLSVPYALYAKSAGSIGSGAGGAVIGTPIFTQGSGVSDIDGNQYTTVKLGSQEWMASNLKTRKFRNGDTILMAGDSAQWAAIWNNYNPTKVPAWCYYNDDSTNNTVYGKLYNGYAVADTRKICPIGWHVPSHAEWRQLINFIDPYNGQGGEESTFAGGSMKSTGTLQNKQGIWSHPNSEATNISGFAAAPSGMRMDQGPFYSGGLSCYWWSSTYDLYSEFIVHLLSYSDGRIFYLKNA
ncbi:MAG: fibrobacter succinogenes major paralogous domain-containing protein, partial [Flavobacteriales bacterium]|nr:fibrobacter succinogenes major paralogous domain-containing protein [Flavobacteriales bacterium]